MKERDGERERESGEGGKEGGREGGRIITITAAMKSSTEKHAHNRKHALLSTKQLSTKSSGTMHSSPICDVRDLLAMKSPHLSPLFHTLLKELEHIPGCNWQLALKFDHRMASIIRSKVLTSNHDTILAVSLGPYCGPQLVAEILPSLLITSNRDKTGPTHFMSMKVWLPSPLNK